MSHAHGHTHASSRRQLSAASIMVTFAIFEFFIGYPARNPLLLGDAVHNFADGMHLLVGAAIDFFVHRSKRHRYRCTLPLTVGIIGFIAPAVIITLIALFETTHLTDLSYYQLMWTMGLALVGVIMNRLAHNRLEQGEAIEASNRFHLIVDMYISMGIAFAAATLILSDSIWPGRIMLYVIALLLAINAVLEISEQIKHTRSECVHRPIA